MSDTLKSWRSVEGDICWVARHKPLADGFPRILDEQMKKRSTWEVGILDRDGSLMGFGSCIPAASHGGVSHRIQELFPKGQKNGALLEIQLLIPSFQPPGQ